MTKELFAHNVPGSTEVLEKKCVAVAGCGGLGSNAAAALVRAGLGKLILADFDRVEESNLNRQYFYQADLGQKKVAALSHYLKAINPRIQLTVHDIKLTCDNLASIMGPADLLVEAFDRAEEKQWLIETWSRHFPEKFMVCGNGLSGLGNTDALKVTRVGRIYFCGDGVTDRSMGLCSARVAIVANMEANVAIELLVKGQA